MRLTGIKGSTVVHDCDSDEYCCPGVQDELVLPGFTKAPLRDVFRGVIWVTKGIDSSPSSSSSSSSQRAFGSQEEELELERVHADAGWGCRECDDTDPDTGSGDPKDRSMEVER